MISKTKKLINSFKYAFSGIVSSFKTERNMKIHVLIMILVIIAGIVFKISKISALDWIILTIMIALVISAELFNTTFETVVDMITKERNEKAKLAKDIAAGAVLVLAIGSIIVGLIIFVPKILEFSK